MKKYLLMSALGFSVILSSCGWILKGTKIDLPGENPVGLNGKLIDVVSDSVGRPEPMSNRTPVAFSAIITNATFADATGISDELSKYGITVGSLSAWGACVKFSGTAVLKNNSASVPAAITISNVSAELTLKDAVVPAGVLFTLKTDPITASVTLTNQVGTNNYSFAAEKLELCAKIEGANKDQLIDIIKSGGTNTVSGLLKYSLDGVSNLTKGSSLTVEIISGTSYIIL